MMKKALILVVLSVLWLGTSPLFAADWPMWRCDAQRSAASTELLPEELHLQWSRQLPPVRCAWPNEPRLQFDVSYEPVVLGKQLFVGSPNDGSVTAFDTETGDENWRFYSDGPVRLAPVAWRNRVYFGSDDGFLYCLNAEQGTLRWRVSGAPSDRGVYRHLGNGRLVSYWPVRGGPVLADGTVYFGAGVWPTLRVFIHAVDAETGGILWTNSDGGCLEQTRIDHNYLHEAGLSPQGYLLVVGDLLVVPNGRSMPARFERRTGKLQYFVQGYRNGDSRVSASGDLAFMGDAGVVNLKDGREVGNRWVAAGDNAPTGWSTPKKDLFEGPIYPYKMVPACNYRSALDGGVAYGVHQGNVYAYDLTRAAISLYEKKEGEQIYRPARWDPPLLWQLATPLSDKPLSSRTTCKAGNRIYGTAGKHLLSVTLSADRSLSPSLAWTKELDSQPSSLLAADGKLFAVTADGQICCYGSRKVQPREHALPDQPISETKDEWTAGAAEILQASDVTGGYAVVLGLTGSGLAEELLRQSELRVITVDEDASLIDALRRRVTADGSREPRFQGVIGTASDVALPAFLASLIVSEDPSAIDLTSTSFVSRLFGILRPYGGTACFRISEEQHDALAKTVREAGLPNAKVERCGNFTCLRRQGPLPGAADWTHETADAARSFFSHDENVKAPLGVLWYGDGRDFGFYKRKDYGHGVKPQVAGGRLFALQIGTRTLHAVDVYTGRLLWVRKVGRSTRSVSTADCVYVASGRQCLVLDPATGEPQATFAIDVNKPKDHPVSVSDVRVAGDVILLAVRLNDIDAIAEGRWNSELLVALDRSTGRQLWTQSAQKRYNTAAITLADGRVVCIDSHSPIEIAEMRRRGTPVGPLPSTIMALDARSGKTIWKIVTNDPPTNWGTLHFMGLRTHDDWLTYVAEHGVLLAGKGNNTYCLEATTGKQVWHKAICGSQPLIVAGDTFINQAGATYETRTGNAVGSGGLFRRGGCNYAVGGKHLVFVRDHCAAYVDVETRKQYNLRNLRSGCSNSLVAADGLLNAPCFSVGCVCNYPIQTSFAMVHMPEVAQWAEISPGGRAARSEASEK